VAIAQMVNAHFDGSQNQRLLQREMERLHTASSSHLDDALSALSFNFASPEMVSNLCAQSMVQARLRGVRSA
jgi:hypothetical protein